MNSEFNQIINLVKSKNEKVEHISYKELHKFNSILKITIILQ